MQNISLNIDKETITDVKVISNRFNKSFNSVAGKRVKKIPNTMKAFDSYLNNLKNSSSFRVFLKPLITDPRITYHLLTDRQQLTHQPTDPPTNYHQNS